MINCHFKCFLFWNVKFRFSTLDFREIDARYCHISYMFKNAQFLYIYIYIFLYYHLSLPFLITYKKGTKNNSISMTQNSFLSNGFNKCIYFAKLGWIICNTCTRNPWYKHPWLKRETPNHGTFLQHEKCEENYPVTIVWGCNKPTITLRILIGVQ